VSHGQNVTVDVLIGSKCHSGRSELGRNVQAAFFFLEGRQFTLFSDHKPLSLPSPNLAPLFPTVNNGTFPSFLNSEF
jgi:hypothetical protein